MTERETMIEYYKTDISRLTYTELWRIRSSPTRFAICAAAKLLGIRLANPTVIPRVDTLEALAPDDVPGWAREQARAALAACEAEGLHRCFFHRFPVLGNDVAAVEAVLIDDDGGLLALAPVTRSRSGDHGRLHLYSPIFGGRWLATVDSVRQLDPSPTQDVAYLPGSPPAQIFAAHRERRRLVAGREGRIDASRVADTVLGMIHDVCDDYVRRGIYVPISRAEVESLRLPGRSPQPR
jgi:hypothetical protein